MEEIPEAVTQIIDGVVFTATGPCYINKWNRYDPTYDTPIQEWVNEAGDRTWLPCTNPTVDGIEAPEEEQIDWWTEEEVVAEETVELIDVPIEPVELLEEVVIEAPEAVPETQTLDGILYTATGPCYNDKWNKYSPTYNTPLQEWHGTDGSKKWLPCLNPTVDGIEGPESEQIDWWAEEETPVEETIVPEVVPQVVPEVVPQVVPETQTIDGVLYTAIDEPYIDRWNKYSPTFGKPIQLWQAADGTKKWLDAPSAVVEGIEGPESEQVDYWTEEQVYYPEPEPETTTEEYKSDKRVIMYHINWGVYGRDYFTADLPKNCQDIVHAFTSLHIDKATGLYVIGENVEDDAYSSVVPQLDPRTTDNWADFEMVMDESKRSLLPYDTEGSGTFENPKGMYGQYKKMEANGYNDVKVTLAIGGWSWSKNFSEAVANQANRESLANSIVQHFKVHTFFKGIALDWEYPSNKGEVLGLEHNIAKEGDADRYLLFCKTLRKMFNENGMEEHTIGLAVAATPGNIIDQFPVSEFADVIDRFEIMTYDFAAGGWSSTTSHHCNLFPKKGVSSWSTHEAVDLFLRLGARPEQIFIGVAMYTRGFGRTDGFGKPCSGDGSDEGFYSYEPGVMDFKHIQNGGIGIDNRIIPKFPGPIEFDETMQAAYAYDPKTRTMLTFDDARSVKAKIQYVHDRGLGGILSWESSQDNGVLQEILYGINDGYTPNPKYNIPVEEDYDVTEEEGYEVKETEGYEVQEPKGISIELPNISLAKDRTVIGIFDAFSLATAFFIAYKFLTKPSIDRSDNDDIRKPIEIASTVL